jgi:hypothetical protein
MGSRLKPILSNSLTLLSNFNHCSSLGTANTMLCITRN